MNVLGSHLASPNLCSGRWKHLVKENWRQATWNQCCGSGSIGYVCFWAFRIRWSQVRIRLRILPSSSKNNKKNLDFSCFLTSLWLFNSVPDRDPYVFGPPGSVRQRYGSRRSASGYVPKCHGSTTWLGSGTVARLPRFTLQGQQRKINICIIFCDPAKAYIGTHSNK
jgi:hypothetical protein